MSLTFVRHEKVSLRDTAFSEGWVHDRICEETSILGFGELDVIARERVQPSGGRLDLLLANIEKNDRYVVEIMLGKTDEAHIVRCIEYWDIERRRYPAYDHVAVLIAEDITTRFLNFMGLLAGSIPLIAIQLDALRLGDQLMLNFVLILDQRDLRDDDTQSNHTAEEVDRNWWESRKGASMLNLCDHLLAFANETAKPALQLRFKRSHLGIATTGTFFNVLILWPRKDFVRLRAALSNSTEWSEKLDTAGLEVENKRDGYVHVCVRPTDLNQHVALLREMIHQSVAEFQK